MSAEIRVLLAEDSPTVRLYLARLIEETPGLRVVGEARDGREALAMVEKLKPDVVSMDINMPHMDGLEATRRIMMQTPTPVVVVSSLLDDDIQLSIQALEAGALAVVGKPPDRQHPHFSSKYQQLVTTLRAMAGVRVISRRHYPRLGDLPDHDPDATQPTRPQRRTKPEIVAIGASTGGPSALHRLLSQLPPQFPLPIVVVQHMPTDFIPGLVRWLSHATSLQVEIAQHHQRLYGGKVYVAGGGSHLTLMRRDNELLAALRQDSGESRHVPAVDVLFDSIAQHCGSAAIGMVLTGMGDDGAAGLLKMRQRGAYTFAQDQPSCTVFGMPSAAIARGAVERVEALVNLAPEILKLV